MKSQLLRRKSTQKQLDEAVSRFDTKVKVFREQLKKYEEAGDALAEENARLRAALDTQSDDRDPLFFTHVREAWAVLTGARS